MKNNEVQGANAMTMKEGANGMMTTNYMEGANNMMTTNGMMTTNNMMGNMMNNSVFGLSVNSELVNYLQIAASDFIQLEDTEKKMEEAKEGIEEAQEKLNKKKRKWRHITITLPALASLIIADAVKQPVLHWIVFVVLLAGTIYLTQYYKKMKKDQDIWSAQGEIDNATYNFDTLNEYKNSQNNYINSVYGYMPEKYRSAYVMSYMLDLAKAGRMQDMAQGFAYADQEIARVNMEIARQQALEEERQHRENMEGGMVAGFVATSVFSLLGGALGAMAGRD